MVKPSTRTRVISCLPVDRRLTFLESAARPVPPARRRDDSSQRYGFARSSFPANSESRLPCKQKNDAAVRSHMRTVLTLLAAAFAVASHATTLTSIAGSTTKVEQMIGDCDYTAQAQTGLCVPTTSRTVTRARVLGTDLGASFESNGRVIFLF